ncbi:hypothetical protein L7F22_028730 [Adiantum nelumboides]|nr:hypothetical protein [Adiantum nelumboides]
MKEVEVREAIERKLVVKVKGHTDKGQLEKVPKVKIALKRNGVKNKAKKHVEKGQEDEGPTDKALDLVGSSKRPNLQVKRAKQSGASCTTSTTVTPYVEFINEGKLGRICRAEPPCASRNTLMEKQTQMIQHSKKVHGLDVFIPQRLGGRPRGSEQRPAQIKCTRSAHTWDVLPRKARMAMKKDTFIMQFVANHMKTIDQREQAMKKEIKSHVEEGYESRRRIKVGTMIVLSETRIKAARGSSKGSDDHGDEDDKSNQDGSGDDDPDYGSDGDADDDDDGNDRSDGGDDISGGSDDEDDGSGGGGSGVAVMGVGVAVMTVRMMMAVEVAKGTVRVYIFEVVDSTTTPLRFGASVSQERHVADLRATGTGCEVPCLWRWDAREYMILWGQQWLRRLSTVLPGGFANSVFDVLNGSCWSPLCIYINCVVLASSQAVFFQWRSNQVSVCLVINYSI